MVAVDLKHLHKVKSKGRWYFYAWRGGPRIYAELGTPGFFKLYNEAVAEHRLPDENKFLSLIAKYRASPAWKRTAGTTKKTWGPWLDKVADHFGSLSIAHFDRPRSIRLDIIQWRDGFAATPRTADIAMQVLGRVLNHGVELGLLAANPAAGIKKLYNDERADIIWTDDDLQRFKKTSTAEMANLVDLAAQTGLRLSDLLRLEWGHVGEHAIILPTGKSKGKVEAIVPLYKNLRDLLDRIPKRADTIITGKRGNQLTKGGFDVSFNIDKKKAWPDGTRLHFHDLRGTAATKFYLAGLSERDIGETLGWKETQVSAIIRKYVDRTASLKDRIAKLDAVKQSVKP